jgi:hypothetical protein
MVYTGRGRYSTHEGDEYAYTVVLVLSDRQWRTVTVLSVQSCGGRRRKCGKKQMKVRISIQQRKNRLQGKEIWKKEITEKVVPMLN